MLGELLLDLGQHAQALAEFEASMREDPNRLLGLAGAAAAAEKAGDAIKARLYYERLVALTSTADTERPEVKKAKQFLAKS